MVIIASPPWLGVREPEVTYLILKRFHLTYRTPATKKGRACRGEPFVLSCLCRALLASRHATHRRPRVRRLACFMV